jgi:hypothetical protein
LIDAMLCARKRYHQAVCPHQRWHPRPSAT